jgi:hypothetical protein
MKKFQSSGLGNSDTIEMPFSSPNNSLPFKTQSNSKNNTLILDGEKLIVNPMSIGMLISADMILNDKTGQILNISEDCHDSTLNEYVTILNGETDTAKKIKPLTRTNGGPIITCSNSYDLDEVDFLPKLIDESSTIFEKKEMPSTFMRLESSEILPIVDAQESEVKITEEDTYTSSRSIKDLVKHSFQNKFQSMKSSTVGAKPQTRNNTKNNNNNNILTNSQAINNVKFYGHINLTKQANNLRQNLVVKSARAVADQHLKENIDTLSSVRTSNGNPLRHKTSDPNIEKFCGLIKKNNMMTPAASKKTSNNNSTQQQPQQQQEVCNTAPSPTHKYNPQKFTFPTKTFYKKPNYQTTTNSSCTNSMALSYMPTTSSPRVADMSQPKFFGQQQSPQALQKTSHPQNSPSNNRNLFALVSPRNNSVPAGPTHNHSKPSSARNEDVKFNNYFEGYHYKSLSITSLPGKKASTPSAQISLTSFNDYKMDCPELAEIDNIYGTLRGTLGKMTRDLKDNEQLKQLLVNLKVFMNGTQTLLCEFKK